MNGKKISVSIALLFTMIIGCIKEEDGSSCTPKEATADTSAIAQYIRDSIMTVDTNTSNWMQWHIVDTGTGASPNENSRVTVKYIGRLVSGRSAFDSSYLRNPAGEEVQLNKIIPGWLQGLSKIKEGGRIQLFLPSNLGYGCDTRYGNLTNQPLYYDIQLIRVSN